jgi:hypothetical protein
VQRRRPHPGFSLIEVAVAGAIASVVGLAAISTFAILARQMTRLQAEAGVNDEAKTIVDALVGELQGVGGGHVRPWMALRVDDGGAGSDRVTWAVSRGETCPVRDWTSAAATSDGAGTACCWLKMLPAASSSGGTGGLSGSEGEGEGGGTGTGNGNGSGTTVTHAQIVVVLGAVHRQVVLSELDTTTCTAAVGAGPLDVSTNTVFTGGVAELVAVQSLYVDHAAHRLVRFIDRDGDLIEDARELRPVVGNVFDLQVQLGYDGDPADGRLVDRGDATDEWLHNVENDALPATVGSDELRMVGVGVVIGAPIADPTYRTTAQVVGGRVIEQGGRHLRGAMGRAALRNVFVFF